MFSAIMKIEDDGRVGKIQDFKSREEAEDHVEKFIEKFPDAFVIERSEDTNINDLLIDKSSKEVSISKRPVILEPEPFDVKSRIEVLETRIAALERKSK